MKNTIKAGALVILCLLAASIASLAQFSIPGVPQIVADLGAYPKLIAETEELINVYRSTEQILHTAELAAKFVTTKDAWTPTATTWQNPTAANTYGNTSGWTNAANTGSGASSGYSSVTVPLEQYGSVLGTYNSGTQSVMTSRYGLIETADGMAANALAQSGAVRAASQRNQAAISQLSSNSRSSDPTMNTEAALLNQAVAAGVIQANQQVQTTQLLASDVDLRAADVAMKREVLAANINDKINFRANYLRLANARTTGIGEAMESFRMTQ